MKSFIRYLYEYEHGKRIRNIGFVKVESQEQNCTIHIHGKGLRHVKGQELELYLFYVDGKRCVGMLQGIIEHADHVIHYRLEYTPDDVGGKERYEGIEGIILLANGNKKFAAVWDDMPVNVDDMIVKRAGEAVNVEPVQTTEPEVEAEERQEMAAEAEPENMPKAEVEEEPETVSEAELQQEETPPVEKTEQMQEIQPVDPISTEPAQNERAETAAVQAGEIQPEEVSTEEVNEEAGETVEKVSAEELQQDLESTDVEMQQMCCPSCAPSKCRKITRPQMTELPRCEWKLANNSFLLHGYHNYHHLVLIEEDGGLFLGVPGIFHEREQTAARTFGFTQFHRPEANELELSKEECNMEEDFGYWCRQVKRKSN